MGGKTIGLVLLLGIGAMAQSTLDPGLLQFPLPALPFQGLKPDCAPTTSPEVGWKSPPEGTKSIAVAMYDPGTISGKWHWLIYNIPPKVQKLVAGAGDPTRQLAPLGSVQGRSDFGNLGYRGPCLPKGSKPRPYIIVVYALKVERLDIPADASAASVGAQLSANALARSDITVYFTP
jgi:hypothetical protein